MLVNALASEGQNGCPVIAQDRIVGLFSGRDTDDNENIIVNLITNRVAKWIN